MNELTIILSAFAVYGTARLTLKHFIKTKHLALDRAAEPMVCLQAVRGGAEFVVFCVWIARAPKLIGTFFGFIQWEDLSKADTEMARFTVLIGAPLYMFELFLRPAFSWPTLIHHIFGLGLCLATDPEGRLGSTLEPVFWQVCLIEIAFGILVFPRGLMFGGRNLKICQGNIFRKLWLLVGSWDVVIWFLAQKTVIATLQEAEASGKAPSATSLQLLKIGVVVLAGSQLMGAIVSFRVASKKVSLIANIYNSQKILKEQCIKPTPLTAAPWISKTDQVFLKREDLQVSGSFKVRGAFSKMSALSKAQRKYGVIACSMGNHACGVAHVAKVLDIKTQLVLPTTTPLALLRRLEKINPDAEVLLRGDSMETALILCKSLAANSRRTFIPPFDDEAIVAGQGTIGLELRQQLPRKDNVDLIFCPVGGGGLLAGVSVAVHLWNPKCRIVGVCMEHSTGMSQSLAVGRPAIGQVDVFARGTAISKPGAIPFAIAKNQMHCVVSVTQEQVKQAARGFFEQTNTIVEPAGVQAMAGAAAFLRQAQFTRPQTVVCIVSGGNLALTDDSFLQYVVGLKDFCPQKDCSEKNDTLPTVISLSSLDS